MPVRLMSLEEASGFLQMEPKELKALVTSGEIPCIYQGTRMMFEHDELDNWYTSRLIRHISVRHTEHARAFSDDIALESYCRVETMEPSLGGKTRAAVLRSMTALAMKSGLLYDPEEFLENLRKREEVSSTAMSEGIALLHPQTRDEYICEAPFLAVGRVSPPIFFGEENGVPTDLFFLVCSSDPSEHLQMVAKLCQVLLKPGFLSSLRSASTSEEMLGVFRGL